MEGNSLNIANKNNDVVRFNVKYNPVSEGQYSRRSMMFFVLMWNTTPYPESNGAIHENVTFCFLFSIAYRHKKRTHINSNALKINTSRQSTQPCPTNELISFAQCKFIPSCLADSWSEF